MLTTVKIKNILDGLLRWVYNNQTDTSIPTSDKYLYRLFYGIESDGYDYLQQAIELVTRTDKNPNKLQTRLQFDPERATMPTIHVTLPSDAIGKQDTLGINTTNLFYESGLGTYVNQYQRSFTTNYDLIITSSNANETDLIYELLMHLFIAGADTLNKHFDLFSYTGREIQMMNDFIPDRIFTKAIGLNVDFVRYTPVIGYEKEFITSLDFEGNKAFKVSFSVSDGTSPLNGVYVLFGVYSGSTDAVGGVEFDSLNGEYNYEIKLTGHITQTGVVIVNSEDQTIDIILIAE